MPYPNRFVVLPIIGLLTLTLVSGCTPTPDGVSPAGPTPPPAVEQTPQPDPIPTLTPTPTPITLGCNDLLSADALYEYNPNFSEIDGYAPAAGSAGAAALQYQGVACRWQNLSSNETIDLSVASLDDASLSALKAKAAQSAGDPVTDFGDQAYFKVVNGVGATVVFDGPYWIVVSSPFFTAASDASGIVDPVLASLG